MTLKKFKGPKSFDTIQAQCEAQDLILRRNKNDDFLRNFVVVSSLTAPAAAVYFHVVDGWFFGTTEDGSAFDSRKPPADAPWFAALQDFFMEPLDIEAQYEALGLNVMGIDGYRALVHAAAGDAPLNLGELAFESGLHVVPFDGYTSKLHGG